MSRNNPTDQSAANVAANHSLSLIQLLSLLFVRPNSSVTESCSDRQSSGAYEPLHKKHTSLR